MAIDEALLEKLKAEHGAVLHLTFREDEGGPIAAEIVVKKPSRAAYKRFRASAHDPAKRADALETIMLDALAYPSREEWNKILDEYPALPETWGGEVMKLLGARQDADAKKY